ncbi:GxxExxY protein [Prosthecobacter vanneervenii]|uniref:GxxExxY protein n=1 Tax=Prosthecobacter vanneervenii TaxID=48466 RepID=A0A7W8DLX7_9BACT|nr:GxxExxY protein [Prosthecobacter vanneervenii]MBB5034505.1 GxxExxY protein [Prosthecobacter vanneervenii]
MSSNLIFPDESFRIRGACFEVYKEKGGGFTEPIYQECLEAELELQGIPFDAQQQFPLLYKGRRLHHTFIPDLVCFDKIIIELKAVPHLTDEHRAQVINYLKATDMKLGLFINFGHHPKVQIERFLNQ